MAWSPWCPLGVAWHTWSLVILPWSPLRWGLFEGYCADAPCCWSWPLLLPPFQGPQILQGLLRPSGVHLPSQCFHVQVRSQKFSPAFWSMYNWGCRCFKFSLIKEDEHNARAGFYEMLVLIQDVPVEVVTYPDSPKPMWVFPPSLTSAPMPYLEHRKDRDIGRHLLLPFSDQLHLPELKGCSLSWEQQLPLPTLNPHPYSLWLLHDQPSKLWFLFYKSPTLGIMRKVFFFPY